MGNKLPFESIRNVLVRGTNWIGDVVMTFPALSAIRETLPKAHIAVLVKPWVADLVRMHPAVDEVLIYERPGRHEGIRGLWTLAGELRARNFDAAILLQNAVEAAIIAYLARIPVRAGYSTDARGIFLTHPVRRSRAVRAIHQSLYYVAMLKSLGFRASSNSSRISLPENRRAAADALLRAHGIEARRPLVGMAPGAAYGPAKRWHADRFAAVADRLVDSFSSPVILFGSAGDRPSTEGVQKASRHRFIDVAGKTGLGDAIALIGSCDVFVTNDSGLMHVAGALDIPTVAIFGSTNPQTTSPPGERTIIIRHPIDCSPCLKPVCPTDFRCMNAITVDEVAGKAFMLLEAKGYRPHG